jgi:rubrerythrin
MGDLERQHGAVEDDLLAPEASASRRRFLYLVGAAGGGVVLAPLLAACGGEDPSSGAESAEAVDSREPATDLEVVNYALFLEFLEEDFYDQIRKSGEIGDEQTARLVEQVYLNEKEHAQALEQLARQLGGAPVDRPRPNFDAVINAGQERIIAVAAQVENLGASAYLGQAANVRDDRILEAALSIHTVEARHAAAFNELAGNDFLATQELNGKVPDGAFAQPRTREQVLELAAPFVVT